MTGTRLLNTRMMIPNDSGRLLPVDTFIGTESTADSAGQVTLSFDIDEFRSQTPVAILLCSADARALGKALIDSADVAERLAEEMRCTR